MKKTILVLILIVLTCGCVLIPRAISHFRQQKLLSETQLRERNMEERETLTKDAVARLYHDREIGIEAGYLRLDEGTSEYEETLMKGNEILEQVFGTGQPATMSLQAMFDSSDIGIVRNTTLVKIGDRATAVGIVSISVKNGNEALEIVFEEKTKILLDIVLSSSDEKSEKEFSLNDLETVVRSYYENVCGIEEDLYTIRMMSENKSLANGFEFGIKQKLTDEEEKNADNLKAVE
ncbi:MAG: hypothetical protein J5379_08800 [Clostridiales bacterium]|nr:hypothetical protein [Clostridiales bacterium]